MIVLFAAGAMVLGPRSGARWEQALAEDCRRQYAAARTPEDSARADAWHPLSDGQRRRQRGNPPTCADLRRLGRLS
jgi:hypothetical protein